MNQHNWNRRADLSDARRSRWPVIYGLIAGAIFVCALGVYFGIFIGQRLACVGC
jgi:uncharacterized membrane protein